MTVAGRSDPAPTPPIVDLSLARRLEGLAAEASVTCVRLLKRRSPAREAMTLEFDGAVATFAGRGSPLSEVLALGLAGAVPDETLDTIERFYEERDSGVRIQLCPLAEPTLARRLSGRGYALVEFEHILVRALGPSDVDGNRPLPPGVSVAPARPDELELWSRLTAEGFFAPEPVPAVFDGMFEAMFEYPGGTPWIARVDGVPAGACAVALHGDLVDLFAMATLPAFRERGVQSALIAARLAEGARRGGTLAVVGAKPGSASHRNLARAGFVVAYTRPLLVRPAHKLETTREGHSVLY
ncbi:MAG: GNAT family N-acetyltransferase [Candidatus Eiseniibacteriota bacterium]